jgi:lysozyme
MNSAAIDLIKRFEGLRLKAYKCSAGVLTVGWGHTAGVTAGTVITEAEAERLLQADVEPLERYIAAAEPQLNVNQQAALISFAFNLGLGALRRSTLWKKVRSNADNPDIAAEFARWCRCGGKVLLGLQRRRSAEAELYFRAVKL